MQNNAKMNLTRLGLTTLEIDTIEKMPNVLAIISELQARVEKLEEKNKE